MQIAGYGERFKRKYAFGCASSNHLGKCSLSRKENRTPALKCRTHKRGRCCDRRRSRNLPQHSLHYGWIGQRPSDHWAILSKPRPERPASERLRPEGLCLHPEMSSHLTRLVRWAGLFANLHAWANAEGDGEPVPVPVSITSVVTAEGLRAVQGNSHSRSNATRSKGEEPDQPGVWCVA